MNVFFFDACRDAPVESGTRSINMTGLSALNSVNQPQGSFIGFSTEYGNVAEDGDRNGHSPFAAAMLDNLDRRANQPIELFYKGVGDDVFRTTEGKQFPIQEPKIRGEYCLVDCQLPGNPQQGNAPGSGFFSLVTKPANASVCFRLEGEWEEWRCGPNVELPIGQTVYVKASAGKHKPYSGVAVLNTPNQRLNISLRPRRSLGVTVLGVVAAAVVAGIVISQQDDSGSDNDGFSLTLTPPFE